MITTKTAQAFGDIFDVEPTMSNIVSAEPLPITEKKDVSSADTDFEIARASIHNALLKSQNALENAFIIANGTEDPDSYNAASKLVERIVDASTKLMSLHDIKNKVTPKTGGVVPVQETLHSEGTSTTTITGPVFVGSTSELAKLLTSQRQTNVPVITNGEQY